MINKVTLIGNLGRDPEVKHLENGSSVARLVVATNENYRDKEGNWQTQTEWHTVIAWRLLADTAERQLKKGSLVYVEGKLRTRQYKDNSGIEKYSTEVEANVLKSLDKRERSDSPLPGESDDPFSGSKPISPPKPDQKEGMDDDLPF